MKLMYQQTEKLMPEFNSQPLDLYYILTKRRVSFERWCLEQNVLTQEDFQAFVEANNAKGEYTLSKHFLSLGLALPKRPSLSRTPTLPPPPPVEEENSVETKKRKK